MVVANCDTPPPTSSTCWPSLMAPAGTKPFSGVRWPTWSLMEKLPPGRDDGAADEVGHAVDVRDPGAGGGVVGGEAGPGGRGRAVRHAWLPPTGSLMP